MVMKRMMLMLGVLSTVVARAATTPLTEPLPEQREITITCELTQAPRVSDVPVFDSSKDAEEAKGTYHYKLWLPAGYHADPQRRWPCLFIASPGGNANMGSLREWVKANGYVVVMLVESRNGPWPPIIGNFLAAHDDVVQRVRIQEGLKIATGFSGAARASSIFVQLRPGFIGLILQEAGAAYGDDNRYLVTGLKRSPLFVAMVMGKTDKNHSEIARMKPLLGGVKTLVLEFDGGHQASPADKMSQALDWIERQIYEEGPPQPALAAVYRARARTQLDQLAALTGWERYKKVEAVLTFARSRNLLADPSLGPSLAQLPAELTRLRADPVIGREAQAADALRNIEQMRERSPAMFVANCRNLAKQFAGTEAAARAQELADATK